MHYEAYSGDVRCDVVQTVHWPLQLSNEFLALVGMLVTTHGCQNLNTM